MVKQLKIPTRQNTDRAPKPTTKRKITACVKAPPLKHRDWLWGPSSILSTYCGSFPGDKATRTWSYPLTSNYCRGFECLQLCLYSPIRLRAFCLNFRHNPLGKKIVFRNFCFSFFPFSSSCPFSFQFALNYISLLFLCIFSFLFFIVSLLFSYFSFYSILSSSTLYYFPSFSAFLPCLGPHNCSVRV
jgi:hypothetical protein